MALSNRSKGLRSVLTLSRSAPLVKYVKRKNPLVWHITLVCYRSAGELSRGEWGMKEKRSGKIPDKFK